MLLTHPEWNCLYIFFDRCSAKWLTPTFNHNQIQKNIDQLVSWDCSAGNKWLDRIPGAAHACHISLQFCCSNVFPCFHFKVYIFRFFVGNFVWGRCVVTTLWQFEQWSDAQCISTVRNDAVFIRKLKRGQNWFSPGHSKVLVCWTPSIQLDIQMCCLQTVSSTRWLYNRHWLAPIHI
jgi:hypothetical protein